MATKKKGRFLVWLAVLSVGGAAAWYWFGRTSEVAPVRYDTAAIDRGAVVARITATGTLSALVTVQVGSQVSGRIKELNVDFNDRVTKGQVLAQLDPQMFEASLAQAQANYDAARAQLTRARVESTQASRQAKRTTGLAARELVAVADAETAQSGAQVARGQIGVAQAAVRQAEASLHQAKVNLSYTTVVSPIDGVVLARSVDVGQTVAASLQAPTLFVLAEDLRKMEVHTSVAEADVGRLQPGMRANFTVDAWPGEKFAGKVRQIRNSATTVQNVVTYDAVVDVANEALKLRPGMTANVAFVLAEREGILRVPNAALRFRPADAADAAGPVVAASAESPTVGRASRKGRRGASADAGIPADTPRQVYVLRAGKPFAVQFRAGLTDGVQTEVVQGPLKEGEKVVTGVAGSAMPKSSGGPPPGAFRVL
ncbi:MAG: efflux RND transporter periplasmic adaptor subunit [Myxococcota bacterium]